MGTRLIVEMGDPSGTAGRTKSRGVRLPIELAAAVAVIFCCYSDRDYAIYRDLLLPA